MTEGIPDGWALAIFIPGALDLVGAGGTTPDEILWKGQLHREPQMKGMKGDRRRH